MNYRTILLATATVMFAGAANAEDITAPMYLPGTGKSIVQHFGTIRSHQIKT